MILNSCSLKAWVARLAPSARCLCLLFVGVLCGSCDPRGEDQTVRIEFWTLALRPTFTEYIEGVLADFEAAHPGVKVDWVDVPYDAIGRKLIAAAAAGRAPDVVNFSDRQFARFASLGATLDLTDLLPLDPDRVYLDGAMRPARVNGQILAVPWYLSTTVQFINTDALRAAGWEASELGDNWATLRDQARTYHQKTGGFLFSQPLAVESELPRMLLADGLVPFEERDGLLRARLTSDDIVAFIEAWVQLYRDGALPREAATSGHAHLVDLYQNGRLAMVLTGANFISRIADAAPDVFKATTIKPDVTGGLGRSHIAVMYLSVISSTQHPKISTELACWVTSPENQLAFCKRVNILPSTPASLNDAHFNPPSDTDRALTTAESKITYARSLSATSLKTAVAFTPALGAWPDMRRAFNERIKLALLDGDDVQHTLAKIEQEWNRILDAGIPAGLDAVPRPQAVHKPDVKVIGAALDTPGNTSPGDELP